MGNETLARRLGGTMAIAILLVAVAIPLTALAQPDKITICHATGQEGTDHFVTLDLPSQAVYGNGGHLEENGSPRAGHEGDHLGPCVGDSTTTSEGTETTEASETEPNEGGGSTSTTLPGDTTSTSSADGSEVESIEETTTTPPTETATAESGESGPEVEASVGNHDEDTDGADVAAQDAVRGGDVGATELPFTGIDQTLVIPGALLLLAGAGVVFLAGGLLEVSGAHIGGNTERMSLGLHRGRHESGQLE